MIEDTLEGWFEALAASAVAEWGRRDAFLLEAAAMLAGPAGPWAVMRIEAEDGDLYGRSDGAPTPRLEFEGPDAALAILRAALASDDATGWMVAYLVPRTPVRGRPARSTRTIATDAEASARASTTMVRVTGRVGTTAWQTELRADPGSSEVSARMVRRPDRFAALDLEAFD